VRRWLGLAHDELRPIGDLNRIVARLAKFSRSETRKIRRRIVTEPGPAGDRQAIVLHLSLAYGAAKPAVLTLEEARALPAALASPLCSRSSARRFAGLFEAWLRSTI
jgi:hypothetical protein